MLEKSFTLFHFSMLPVRQLDVETKVDLTRENWLREALSEPFSFPSRGGAELFWVPKGELEESFYGLIQREIAHARHRPPNEGGDEIVTEEWQGAYVVLDPTSHEQGQRIAVENDVVGMPEPLIKYLVKEISSRPEAPFVTEVEPIFDASTFWSFVDKHGGLLRWIKFQFVVPNMWGTESELEQELKATRDDTGAERVDITMRGEQGVEAPSNRVTQGVDYAEKGAGKIVARSKDGTKYQSDDVPKRTTLEILNEGWIG